MRGGGKLACGSPKWCSAASRFGLTIGTGQRFGLAIFDA